MSAYAHEIKRRPDEGGGEWVIFTLPDGWTVQVYTVKPVVWVAPETH